MRIEHFGYQVEKPAAVAGWYVEHLGFQIVRNLGGQTETHFLADDGGQMMVEIYNNPAAPMPDYDAIDPLVLHMAFVVEADAAPIKARLLAAGATIAIDTTLTPGGDELTMLRDPWGFSIQLCKRARPMV